MAKGEIIVGTRRIEYRRLQDIARADRNAKDHDGKGIAASVTRFGFVEPPIVDGRTEKLVGGHGRYDELERRKKAGGDAPEGIDVRGRTWYVPVVVGWSSVDDEDALAMGVALNRLVERGGWVRERLYEDLTALAVGKRGLTGVGYEPADLDALRALQGAGPDLGRLSRELGEPDETQFWPEVKLKLSPEVKARWDKWWRDLTDVDDNASDVVARLLDVLDEHERCAG